MSKWRLQVSALLAAFWALATAADHTGAADLGASLVTDTRLPKINVYISRNEIKKLLGIDARINYVSNGNIDTYPLGFTIPLGYNQSDMIFTWQNLGQTNVNYSISLVIGNIQAVNSPLINITRSGLIPKHEQVFKITLPCSGKVTDEVDVQVLINIVGAPEDPEEPSERLVTHTLAIKRKKICTMHPVQVPVAPRVAPVAPPTPPAAAAAAAAPTPAPAPPNRWPEKEPEGATPISTAAPTASPARPPADDLLEASTRKLEQLNLIQTRASPATPAELAFYPSWPRARPADSPLLEPPPAPATPRTQQAPDRPASPLVLVLTGLSLLVSAALVLLVLLGSASRRLNGASPLDKLTALTSCLIRSPAANKCKRPPPMMPVSLGATLRTGLKPHGPLPPTGQSASASPSSADQKSPSYWFKATSGCSNQYLHHYQHHPHLQQQQQQQQHYQQPPIADLLGAGYLCGQPLGVVGSSQTLQHHQQAQQQPQCPIYHIATNHNQTTRLIWSQGNGVAADGFTIEGGTYMPLSNAGCSETENVYQKIY